MRSVRFNLAVHNARLPRTHAPSAPQHQRTLSKPSPRSDSPTMYAPHPQATSPRPSSWTASSSWTRRAISSPHPTARRPASRACSRRAMCRTTSGARPSPPRAPAAWQVRTYIARCIVTFGSAHAHRTPSRSTHAALEAERYLEANGHVEEGAANGVEAAANGVSAEKKEPALVAA